MTHFEQEKHSVIGKRMSLLFMVIFIALAVLIFRLSFLQLSKGEAYLKQAESNRYITQSIPAPRGIIMDRQNNVLVRNKPAFTITYQPLSEDVQDTTALIAELSPVIGLSIEDMYRAMDPSALKYPPSQARKIVTNASDQAVAYVREHADQLPGINVVVEPIREYTNGAFASHVLGYLNDIPKDYYDQHQERYRPTDVIGNAGVEKQYEEFLHGKNGTYKVEVNTYYQPVNKDRAITVEPIKGHDLKLTLDSKLQEATENALASQVQNLSRTIKTIKNGAAIAMDPRTGEILAMASYPDYDPKIWVDGITTQQYKDIFAPAEMNRAIQQVYEPGSTIKMSTVLIGLHEGLMKPYDSVNDTGITDYLGAQIRSWRTLGYVDARRSLALSSNAYMIEVFKRLGGWGTYKFNDWWVENILPKTMDKILEYHKSFGMGLQTTGVDLPHEAEGQITRENYPADLAFASFGQNEKYTLMQLANYVSTIANDGKRMLPYVVSEIVKPDGTTLQKTEPKLLNEVPFTQEELRVVQEGMYGVTHDIDGTFTEFAKYPIKVAGKTGTAETGRGTENSLFVGYAPYDNPTIAIAIIIPDNERNGHSSTTLAPIAKQMFDAYFKLNEQKEADKKTP